MGPPALAGRVYAQLLRASFDPVDEGAVSDDLDAFRDALLHPEGAARAMGIRPAAHAALHAWCLARHHRAWIVGEGPLATSPTTARSAGARAFAFAADAEADADEPEEAYALLTAATRALARVEDAERDEREMRRTRHAGREETLDDDVGAPRVRTRVSRRSPFWCTPRPVPWRGGRRVRWVIFSRTRARPRDRSRAVPRAPRSTHAAAPR